MKTGVLGGTFDPVHAGHVALGKAACEEAGLDRLIVMPAYIQPFKKDRKTADDRLRFEMAELAFDFPEAIVMSYELDKQTISYTYDTMTWLSEQYPEDDLFFILGTDSFLMLESWYKGVDLLKTVDFIVSVRPGCDEKELDETIRKYGKLYNAEVFKVKTEMPDVSSTEIRRRVSSGESITGLVTGAVEKYIYEHNLYKDSEIILKIREYIEKNLTEKRLKHTEGVISTAAHLAALYGADKEKAYLAALAHDMCKKISPEEQERYADLIGLDEIYRTNLNLAHSKIAAYVLENEFGVKDADILNAVSYHTTGRADMSVLEKVIFIADAIEPGRDYPAVKELREAAETDLDKACLLSMKRTIEYVTAQGQYLDNDTLKAYESLANNK